MFAIREFRPPDAPATRALHDLALDDAGVHGGHGPWEADLDDVKGTYIDAGGAFIVASTGDLLVGMGGLTSITSRRCEIRRMRVHPDFQRRGLGRLLLAALERRASELGFVSVSLDTTSGQLAAIGLYESAGYRRIGEREVGRFVFIDFEKSLTA